MYESRNTKITYKLGQIEYLEDQTFILWIGFIEFNP
jgi:hypothetical protein